MKQHSTWRRCAGSALSADPTTRHLTGSCALSLPAHQAHTMCQTDDRCGCRGTTNRRQFGALSTLPRARPSLLPPLILTLRRCRFRKIPNCCLFRPQLTDRRAPGLRCIAQSTRSMAACAEPVGGNDQSSAHSTAPESTRGPSRVHTVNQEA
jgi:hypothetical protein